MKDSSNQIYDATLAISKELEITSLLKKVLEVVIDNSKADRGLFCVFRSGELYAASERLKGQPVKIINVSEDHFLSNDQLPLTILNSVIKTQEVIKVENATTNGLYFNDSYVKSHQPKSLVIWPIVHKGELNAVIYLEGKSTNNQFNPLYDNKLSVVAQQVAISLNNAFAHDELLEQVESALVAKEKAKTSEALESIKIVRDLAIEIRSMHNAAAFVQLLFQKLDSLLDLNIVTISKFSKDEVHVHTFDKINGLKENLLKGKEVSNTLEYKTYISQKPTLSNNVDGEFVIHSNGIDIAENNSFVIVPVQSKGYTNWVLCIHAPSSFSYDKNHISLLEAAESVLSFRLEFLNSEKEFRKKIRKLELENEEHGEGIVQKNKELKEKISILQKENEHIRTLSALGQDIVSSKTLESLITKIYDAINLIMDASFLSLGVYEKNENALVFKFSREKDSILPEFRYSLSDEKYLAVYSYSQLKQIFIEDYEKEYKKLIDRNEPPAPPTKLIPASVIILPLIGSDSTIGVLTVQSFKKKAFTLTHFQNLEYLSEYINVALENVFLLENK